MRASVVLAHDYLTQRGGAERVVLAMARAFPKAPLVTSMYLPSGTYPEFVGYDVRTTFLQRSGLILRHHRLGLPLYGALWRAMQVDAEVAICSTSGWAHRLRVTGAKVLYVHNTARWLYQSAEQLRRLPQPAQWGLGLAIGPLRRGDRVSGNSADMVLANSRQVQRRIRQHWGIDADVLYPAHGVDPSGVRRPVAGVEEGYVLAVTRLLPYKRVDVLVAAMAKLPAARLVIVGTGPDLVRLQRMATPNCTFLGTVTDEELRWLYANCLCVASAAAEDLGLVPLEAMAFGRPVAVLRAGGFEETTVEGETGVFFDAPTPAAVAAALRRVAAEVWSREVIANHAATFSEAAFGRRLRELVAPFCLSHLSKGTGELGRARPDQKP